MRRVLGASAAGLALAAVAAIAAVPARAAISDWTGSEWTAPSPPAGGKVGVTASPQSISGHFQYDRPALTVNAQVTYRAVSVATGCTAPTSFSVSRPWTSNNSPGATSSVVDFSRNAAFPCNGTYQVSALGTVLTPGGQQVPDGSTTGDQGYQLSPSPMELDVRVPAPPPQSVVATAYADRSVTVSWSPPAGYDTAPPPDFTGYAINRTSGSTTKTVAMTDATTTSFKDTSVPDSGGTFTYDVYALRRGETDSAPPVLSPAASSKPAVVAPLPSSTSSSGGGGSGQSGPGFVIEGTTTTSVPPGEGVVINRPPASGSGNPGRPSATPGAPAQEPDPGFESSLPYEAEGGAVAARLPSGGVERAGAGLVVPFALALLLGVWGSHVIYMTKTARQADEALAALEVEQVELF